MSTKMQEFDLIAVKLSKHYLKPVSIHK